MSEPFDPTPDDRLLAAIRALIRAEYPQFTFTGVYEYSIKSADIDTVDCVPTDATLPLPELTKVPMRSGILGATANPTPGLRCLIAFVNSDPTRPVCISTDPSPVDAKIDATATMELGKSTPSVAIAGGVLGAARLTDTVLAGPFAGVITSASLKTRIG